MLGDRHMLAPHTRLKLLQFRLKDRVSRVALGLRFILGSWSEDDAKELRWEAQRHEGFYPLLSISKDNLIAELTEVCPELPDNIAELAHRAASRTADKWTNDPDDQHTAIEMARDYAAAYAREAGMALIFEDDDND